MFSLSNFGNILENLSLPPNFSVWTCEIDFVDKLDLNPIELQILGLNDTQVGRSIHLSRLKQNFSESKNFWDILLLKK